MSMCPVPQMRMFRVAMSSLLIALAAAAPSLADAGWVLTTADLRQEPVALVAVETDGVTITRPASPQPVKIGFDSFLQIDRAAPQRAPEDRFCLHLAGGQRVPGKPVGYKDENIVWRSAALGELAVPVKLARAMVRSGRSADAIDQPRTDDIVLMTNGDTARGIVSDITSDTLMLNVGADTVTVALDSVDVLYFAVAGRPPASSARAFRIRLTDGTIMTFASAESRDNKLRLTALSGSVHEVPMDAVTSVEQLNGPVAWLSSRLPDVAIHTPFFGGMTWPPRMDLTASGKPIQFGGRTYTRGIGVHSYSRLEYSLDGSYEAFRTQYAIATDVRNQYADVTVRIKVDDAVVHEAQHVRAGMLSPVVLIDLPRTAKKLTLEVDYGDAHDTQDHFNWIEPALLRKKPADTRPSGG